MNKYEKLLAISSSMALITVLILSVLAATTGSRVGNKWFSSGGVTSTVLNSDGDYGQDEFVADYDGCVENVRIEKTGAECTSIEWWLLEDHLIGVEGEDVPIPDGGDAETIADMKHELVVVLSNENEPMTVSSDSFNPRDKECQPFRSVSKNLTMLIKAHGGACDVTFKVFGRYYDY